jgi:hypothetical protein
MLTALHGMCFFLLQEKLQLTPQQEQILEAHQALFEQRAQALAGSKAAVLAALDEAAARQDDTRLLQVCGKLALLSAC